MANYFKGRLAMRVTKLRKLMGNRKDRRLLGKNNLKKIKSVRKTRGRIEEFTEQDKLLLSDINSVGRMLRESNSIIITARIKRKIPFLK
jgi:hypothetical protein